MEEKSRTFFMLPGVEILVPIPYWKKKDEVTF
jgi:hypothetical protein